jgi:nucleotide-binding universal stress UspA family protein
MFKKILLAYDGSAPAKKGFERSLEMARCFNAELCIVAVARPPEFAEDVETEAILENARSHLNSELGKLRAQACSSGVQPSLQVRVGHPAEQIIAAAEEWNADLIVTGHRGKGLFERWLLRFGFAPGHCVCSLCGDGDQVNGVIGLDIRGNRYIDMAA